MYKGIVLFKTDTIDLPVEPYSNIILNVSIGSFPIPNRINDVSPTASPKATTGADKLISLNLSFISLALSYNFLKFQV